MLRKNPDLPASRDLKTALEDIRKAIEPIFEDLARAKPDE
jgi:hypothetical protein